MSLHLDKSTWKRVAFGDVVESITERVDNPSEAGVDRYVGLEHLDPGVMTVQRWDSPDRVAAQKLRFLPGDVIFGRRRAYQRKVAKAEFEGICSAHALVLRARSNLIHPDFLPVFLSSSYFLDRAIEISVGSLSPTVNWRDLRGQEFCLPPHDIQKRIADLVWTLERHRQSLQNLGSVLTGEQIKDPRSARAALINHALEGHNGEWSSVPLGSVGTFLRGRRFTKEDYVDEGIPCIHYGQIFTEFDAITYGAITFVSEAIRPKLRFAVPGDLIIAGTSETVDDVCKAVAWLGDGDVAVHDDCFIFRHDLEPRFASYLFASQAFQRQKVQYASVTKVARVSSSNLARIVVPIPPRSTQVRIADQIDELTEAGNVLHRELTGLKLMRSAIFFAAFGDL